MMEDFYFVRPKTGQKLLVGQREVPSPQPKIFSAPPRLGLVISTFGSVPHVELALAVRKRFYPTLPVLVHDDASPQGVQLAQLCDEHDAEFETNSARLGHEMGDLAGIIGGLRWAQERGIDLLVRMTRRFIPVTDWTAGLARLAYESQAGSYGQVCQKHGFALRTECMAMFTGHWALPEIAGEISAFVLKNRSRIYVERYLYTYVGKVYEMSCGKAREWERHNIRTEPRLMYAPWDFLEPSRVAASSDYLWHESAPPEAYGQCARQLGLNYADALFKV